MAVFAAALESFRPAIFGRCAIGSIGSIAGDEIGGCGESRRDPPEGDGDGDGDGESILVFFFALVSVGAVW